MISPPTIAAAERVDRTDDELGDETAEREAEEGGEPAEAAARPLSVTVGATSAELHGCS